MFCRSNECQRCGHAADAAFVAAPAAEMAYTTCARIHYCRLLCCVLQHVCGNEASDCAVECAQLQRYQPAQLAFSHPLCNDEAVCTEFLKDVIVWRAFMSG